MESPPVKVVCAIIERGELFLAARRGAHETNPLLWEFPGGKVEPGESEQDALMRELDEELGVEVIVGGPLKPVVHEYPWIIIELTPFICKLINGEPRALEHDSIAWIDPSNARNLSWAPADVPVLREYLEERAVRGHKTRVENP